MRHVYLDDIRACPYGWELVKNYDECIAALLQGNVSYLSLDHDLAEEHYAESSCYTDVYAKPTEKTGYCVCRWMVENNVWPSVSITLHSANLVGRNNMRQLLLQHAPTTLLIFG